MEKEQLGYYKVWLLVENKEIEYGDYHRKSSAEAVEKKLTKAGYSVFVEDLSM